MADGSLTGADLADGPWPAGLLAPGSVTGSLLADGTLTGDKAGRRVADRRQLAAGSLAGGQLADGAVAGDKLADGRSPATRPTRAVTGDKAAEGSAPATTSPTTPSTGDDIDEAPRPRPAGGPRGPSSSPARRRARRTSWPAPTRWGQSSSTRRARALPWSRSRPSSTRTTGSRFIQVSPTRNGAPIGYYDWDAGDVDGLFDQRQTGFSVVPVAAGTHTFAFSGDGGADQRLLQQVLRRPDRGAVLPDRQCRADRQAPASTAQPLTGAGRRSPARLVNNR